MEILQKKRIYFIKPKDFCLSLVKVFCSAITSFLILNLLLHFYYHLPVHIANPDNTTDYKWEPKSSWLKMTEGIAWGGVDRNGFINKTVVENPDILILGSSHMEATNVRQNENTAAILKDIFEKEDFPFTVYNKGISGHAFLKCCKYLYKNTNSSNLKYAVIETASIKFTEKEIDNLLNGKIDFTSSHSTGIIYCLQKMPLFRLMWSQADHGLFDLFLPKKKQQADNSYNIQTETSDLISENYEKLFSYIAENSNGKKIIIFYHPTGIPKADGSLEYETDLRYLACFESAAKKHGITFLDLTNETENLWLTEHKTTHGFCTGTAFSGHLNRNGHKITARKIADYIVQEEKSNVAF